MYMETSQEKHEYAERQWDMSFHISSEQRKEEERYSS